MVPCLLCGGCLSRTVTLAWVSCPCGTFRHCLPGYGGGERPWYDFLALEFDPGGPTELVLQTDEGQGWRRVLPDEVEEVLRELLVEAVLDS